MTLRDAHLQQALRHAPDRDVVPNPATRDEIMAYAAKAVGRGEFWLVNVMHSLNPLRWQINSWQLAGMSSAAVALLVVVALWDLPRDEPLRMAAGPDAMIQGYPAAVPEVRPEQEMRKDQEVRVDQARTEPSRARLASPPVKGKADVPPAAERRQLETTAATAGQAAGTMAAPMPAAPVVAAADKQEVSAAAGTANSVEADRGSEAAPALKEAVALEKTDALSRKAETFAGASKDADVLRARPAEKAVLAKKIMPAAAPPSQVAAAAPDAGAASAGLAAARMRGAERAAKDIQAGVLRILALAQSWPAGQALADAATGYRVELVAESGDAEALQAEVEAYNQAMRDWHSLKSPK